MKIVAMSDIHGQYDFKFEIPDGDVIVHCGDISHNSLEIKNVNEFIKFFSNLPHKYKICIAGNHDFIFENNSSRSSDIKTQFADNNIIYLQDSEVIIDGVKFYGTPWQPWFYDWAFNLRRGSELKAIWDKIPDDVNVLLTHGGPSGILDYTERGEHVGCEDLLCRVNELQQLKLHCFGHIHNAYGVACVGGKTYINACTCNEAYKSVNPPLIYNYEV